MSGPHILVLGGTSEARALATLIAARTDLRGTLSLAGRTSTPAASPLAQRIGGFGGADGLRRWIVDHGVDAVIDATHPFAARISANAVAACAGLVPLVILSRPPWMARPGDRWKEVDDFVAAAAAIGAAPQRAFLTVGRLELAAFAAAPQHDYLARVIDPPDPLPPLPRLRLIQARGPFDADAEVRLMRDADITVLVTKNAGGSATAGKLDAARRLGVPVVLVRRPDPIPGVPTAHHPEVALRTTLERLGHAHDTVPAMALRGE